MNAAQLIDSLARFPDVLSGALGGLDPERARWRPEGGGWSLLDIAHHLADEEVEDFRMRLERTLRDPAEEWPGIDPEARVLGRREDPSTIEQVLARFRSERARSVDWLRSLETPDWTLGHRHPSLGELRAGDLLLSWVEHDWLHLRQVARGMFQLGLRSGEGFDAGYAGAW